MPPTINETERADTTSRTAPLLPVSRNKITYDTPMAPHAVVPGKLLASSRPLGWKGIVVERHIKAPPSELEVSGYVSHFISLQTRDVPHQLRRIGDHCYEGPNFKGNLYIVPAMIPAFFAWDIYDDAEEISLEPASLRRVAAEAVGMDPGRVELLPVPSVRDPQLEGIVSLFLSELEQGGVGGRLYVDSLTDVLAIHLLRKYCARQVTPREYKGGLPRYKLRRVTEYMREHLQQSLTLTELAAEVGMSTYHFARMFKHSTGLAPHQYMTQRRLECARRLLTDTELPIVEIASEVGFESQSHFTTLFRKHISMTPKAYRAATARFHIERRLFDDQP